MQAQAQASTEAHEAEAMIDLAWWWTLATGFATGVAWCRRDAIADWLASWPWLVGPEEPVVLPSSHPAVRVVRDAYDWSSDE